MKDDIAKNYESNYLTYKQTSAAISDQVDLGRRKIMEQFDYTYMQPQKSQTYRLDYLSIMYECKINQYDVSWSRIAIAQDRFKRLEKCSEKSNQAYLYLNACSNPG